MIKINQVLHVSDVPNLNGHIYHGGEVIEAFTKHYERGIVYVSPYPLDGQVQMNPERVAATIDVDTIRFKNDGTVIGDVKYLKTPMGKILSTLLEEGLELQYGLIGFGKLIEDDYGNKHLRDFSLCHIGVDCQPNVSKPEALEII